MENLPSLEGFPAEKSNKIHEKVINFWLKFTLFSIRTNLSCRRSILLLYYYISLYTEVYGKLPVKEGQMRSAVN
jgi:hypothetical protein